MIIKHCAKFQVSMISRLVGEVRKRFCVRLTDRQSTKTICSPQEILYCRNELGPPLRNVWKLTYYDVNSNEFRSFVNNAFINRGLLNKLIVIDLLFFTVYTLNNARFLFSVTIHVHFKSNAVNLVHNQLTRPPRMVCQIYVQFSPSWYDAPNVEGHSSQPRYIFSSLKWQIVKTNVVKLRFQLGPRGKGKRSTKNYRWVLKHFESGEVRPKSMAAERAKISIQNKTNL
jgi:hypothetical protein